MATIELKNANKNKFIGNTIDGDISMVASNANEFVRNTINDSSAKTAGGLVKSLVTFIRDVVVNILGSFFSKRL